MRMTHSTGQSQTHTIVNDAPNSVKKLSLCGFGGRREVSSL